VVLGLASTAVCSQENLKVAIPQRGAWDAGVAELGQRGGIFKKYGLSLEILYVQAGPESIQAVIGGSMDIATAAGVSAAVGTFAKGAPIRIIGSEMIGAPDLYWYVPVNSPIQRVEDFNGKTVAYSLTGSSSHAALLALDRRQMRSALVAEASVALWQFIVQREACGLRDMRQVLRAYAVPAEVAARMGALPVSPGRLRSQKSP
jgi:ABC-type taurine transport system substrate-binding protein